MKSTKSYLLAAIAATAILSAHASVAAQTPADAGKSPVAQKAETAEKPSADAKAEKGGRPSRKRNVAIVVDRSASLGMRHFETGKERAAKILESLDGGDFVSLVAFGEQVEVLGAARPATGEVKKELAAKIENLKQDAKSALFAGIAKGADELRKNNGPGIDSKLEIFTSGDRKNMVGPSQEDEFARLAESLAKEKIKISGALRRNKGHGARRDGEGEAGQPRRKGGRARRSQPAAEKAKAKPASGVSGK